GAESHGRRCVPRTARSRHAHERDLDKESLILILLCDADLLVAPAGRIFGDDAHDRPRLCCMTEELASHLFIDPAKGPLPMLPAPAFFEPARVPTVHVERAALVAEVAEAYRKEHA